MDRRRVAVVGVFELVARHLAFDDPRVGPGTSGGKQFVEDLGGDGVVGVIEGLRGKNPGGWRSFGGRPEVIG